MKLCYPRLSAQVLQINNDGFFGGNEQACKVALREITSKGFNHNVWCFYWMTAIVMACLPGLDIDAALDFWINPRSE